MMAFVMLNPSTADEREDDNTIRRCIGYARKWNFGGLFILNIFAYCATDPDDMKAAPDPIGAENDHWIDVTLEQVDLAVAAWGSHGLYLGRGPDVLKRISQRRPIYCLATNADGQPGHPLYLPKANTLKRLAGDGPDVPVFPPSPQAKLF